MTSLVLVGCGGDRSSAPAATATSTSTSAPTPAPTPSPTPPAAASTAAPSTPAATDSSPAPTGATGNPSASGESTASGPGKGSGNGSGAALEMPEAPEQTATSLSELLEGMNTAPLVTAPLPRGADADGRLVTRFPTFLRPTRASRVDSSSVSPSGSRLQVALVGSTSLAPADVLLAYRTRLGGRGLVEQVAPAATAGSEAAAFRRGRSTVTVTVTAQGSGTSYSVHASLHTGSE